MAWSPLTDPGNVRTWGFPRVRPCLGSCLQTSLTRGPLGDVHPGGGEAAPLSPRLRPSRTLPGGLGATAAGEAGPTGLSQGAEGERGLPGLYPPGPPAESVTPEGEDGGRSVRWEKAAEAPRAVVLTHVLGHQPAMSPRQPPPAPAHTRLARVRTDVRRVPHGSRLRWIKRESVSEHWRKRVKTRSGDSLSESGTPAKERPAARAPTRPGEPARNGRLGGAAPSTELKTPIRFNSPEKSRSHFKHFGHRHGLS